MVLFALAVLALQKVGRVVEVGLQIASVAYGALLGVFLLGVLTKRANQRGAMVGMLFGFSMELYLWRMQVPWTWWVMIGTIVTFAVGWLSSEAVYLIRSDVKSGRRSFSRGEHRLTPHHARGTALAVLDRSNYGPPRAPAPAISASAMPPPSS